MDVLEDHCWRDAVPADVFELYSHYRRDIATGSSPALLAIELLAIDLYAGVMKAADIIQQLAR